MSHYHAALMFGGQVVLDNVEVSIDRVSIASLLQCFVTSIAHWREPELSSSRSFQSRGVADNIERVKFAHERRISHDGAAFVVQKSAAHLIEN